MGSMLSYAQGRLSPTDWGTVSKALPGADSYLRAATDALGSGNITSAAGLDSAFAKLGMKPEMVQKFAPIVSDYVGKQGGAAASKLIAGVF